MTADVFCPACRLNVARWPHDSRCPVRHAIPYGQEADELELPGRESDRALYRDRMLAAAARRHAPARAACRRDPERPR